MDIQLNLVNNSNDETGSDVVVFATNVATDAAELAVAWQVICNCAQGDSHPFVFPAATEVGAEDSWGNFSPRLPAEPGDLFSMTRQPSGDVLQRVGPGSSPTEIQVLNGLQQGAIDASVYKAGKRFATRTDVAPQQKAVFTLSATLWVGVASEVVEGQVIDSAIVSSIDTQFTLTGVASADIVMTGGGPGPTAQPFRFELANVVLAG